MVSSLVKCVLCKKKFENKDALKAHFVKDHNVPKGDKTLNRYVNLRFSNNAGEGGSTGRKYSYTERKLILVRLLKLLKNSISREELEREKILIDTTKIGHILSTYLNSSDDDVDSNHSNSSMETDFNVSKKNIVIWFMKFYNLFVNNNADKNLYKHEQEQQRKRDGDFNNKKRAAMASYYDSDERSFTKCARLKIEQKESTSLDFTKLSGKPVGAANSTSCYYSFIAVQKAIYKEFIANFDLKKASKTEFQILIEMSTEFVRTDNEEEGDDDEEEDWENEGTFYTGRESATECVEQRSINEYSAFSSGSLLAPLFTYDNAMNSVSQKVLNSYNVIGSNWSLRRIISSNITILHNIDSEAFSSRLVMGKIVNDDDDDDKPTSNAFNADRFTQLFNMCYENVQLSRKNRERAKTLLKGTLAKTSRSRNNCLLDLHCDDRTEIKSFAEKYGHMIETNVGVKKSASVKIQTTPVLTTSTRQDLPPPIPPKNKRQRKTVVYDQAPVITKRHQLPQLDLTAAKISAKRRLISSSDSDDDSDSDSDDGDDETSDTSEEDEPAKKKQMKEISTAVSNNVKTKKHHVEQIKLHSSEVQSDFFSKCQRKGKVGVVVKPPTKWDIKSFVVDSAQEEGKEDMEIETTTTTMIVDEMKQHQELNDKMVIIIR